MPSVPRAEAEPEIPPGPKAAPVAMMSCWPWPAPSVPGLLAVIPVHEFLALPQRGQGA